MYPSPTYSSIDILHSWSTISKLGNEHWHVTAKWTTIFNSVFSFLTPICVCMCVHSTYNNFILSIDLYNQHQNEDTDCSIPTKEVPHALMLQSHPPNPPWQALIFSPSIVLLVVECYVNVTFWDRFFSLIIMLLRSIQVVACFNNSFLFIAYFWKHPIL